MKFGYFLYESEHLFIYAWDEYKFEFENIEMKFEIVKKMHIIQIIVEIFNKWKSSKL